MKNRLFNILFMLAMVTLISCSEDNERGLKPADGVAPAAPVVKNIKNANGEAVIFYEVPKDKDLLYVVATYNNNETSVRTTKASVYVDSVVVNGFGRAGTYNVTLKSVDRSGNESTPVEVKVEPTTPPVMAIYETLKPLASWGGIKLSWINETQANVIVTIKVKDNNDEWVDSESIYSNSYEGIGSVRGLEAVEQNFRIVVRDRFDNFSEEMPFTCTPWREEQLDRLKFKEVPRLPGDCLLNQPLRNIWDGVKNIEGSGFLHGNARDGGGIGRFVTFDLGKTTKLSRYKYYQRLFERFTYNHNNIKEWKMYGCTEITDDMYNKTDVSADVLGGRFGETADEYNAWVEDQIEGWTLIEDAKCYRPSGIETGGNYTNEDLEYITKGDEHEIDLEVPPVRYIRILFISNWSGGVVPQISEMEFWGQYQDEE